MEQTYQEYIRYLLDQRAQLEIKVLQLTEELKKKNEPAKQEGSTETQG